MTGKPDSSSRSTKRGRGRPKAFDRDDVLAVAMRSYWHDGVDAVSVNEISRRAGISKPGLYREFGSEDDLMAEALEYYLTTVRETQPEPPPMATSLSDKIDGLIRTLANPGGEAEPGGCLMVKMQTNRPRLGERAGVRIDELTAHTRSMYADIITDAVTRGELKLDVPVEVAVDYLDHQLRYLAQLVDTEGLDAVYSHANLAFSVFGYQYDPHR